jgi:hypothetical protein
MTSFREKLKEIRASEADRARHRVPLSDHELGLDQPAERFLAARGELVRDLERLMNEFIAESPMFEIGHGFFEGKYVLSLSCDEPLLDEARGGLRKQFTRINFLLDPCSPDGTFSITTKVTIRDRDLPKGVMEGNLGTEGDLAAFRKFGEEQMLRFATDYFAGHAKPQPAHPVS